MASNEIITSAARIWLDGDGILNVVSLGVRSTEESGREFMAAKLELAGDRRAALLLDARKWPGGTPTSWRQFVATLEGHFFACAVIASETAIREMGVFPKVFDDLLIPFRVFEDAEPARGFLRSHIDQVL